MMLKRPSFLRGRWTGLGLLGTGLVCPCHVLTGLVVLVTGVSALSPGVQDGIHAVYVPLAVLGGAAILRGVTLEKTEKTTLPRVGDRAPDFRLPSTEGHDLGLDDFRGRQAVVLYFYPRDDTPGCTQEACSFRDLLSKFQAKNVQVLGVSADSVRSHKKFQQKYGLTFPLLADTDHQVAERYGVWQQKRFMGREYMGVARTTFVIDQQGVVKAVFPNVKVQGHADAVLAALEG